jgi:8-oxo-dGTP diphosphatase
MPDKKSLLDKMLSMEDNFLPNISIDCVIFGYHERELKILCSRTHKTSGWILPGGFVRKDIPIDDAAKQVLTMRTGLDGLFLKQFMTFGNSDRIWRNSPFYPELEATFGPDFKKLKWISERMVSIGYYALTDFIKVIPAPGLLDYECKWFNIKNLPVFMLDHKQIFKEAFKSLKLHIHTEPIGLNLLPQKFTLGDLQALYETILEKKLDQRNFTKKLMTIGVIQKLQEKKFIGGHRSPYLFQFDKKTYFNAVKNGIELAF